MLARDLTRCAIAAAGVLLLLHLLIRKGGERLFSLVSMGFMPGSYAELGLSGSPMGFGGDWRTLLVVNLFSWLFYLLVFLLAVRVWRR
jgi:hypothetical protein